jgi:uncharacterized protein (DUF58 family)
MSLEDLDDGSEQASCLSMQWQLTALAKSLLWLSGSIATVLLLASDFHPTAFLLSLVCLVLLLFATSWWLGRTALSCLVPTAVQPATGFTWEMLPIRFGLHHVGDRFAARDVLLYHGSQGNHRGLFAYRACIDPGAAHWVDGSLRLQHRGRFLHHGLRLVSTFPFGLLRWTAAWKLPADIIALPRLGALRDAMSLIPAERETVESGAGRFTDTEEFHTLKRWRPGMSQRLVHWKSTARRGHLMVREMHGVRYPRLRLELVAPAPGFGSPRNQRLQFENAICLTATLADFFLRRNYRVELSCVGVKEPFFLEAQRGRHGLFQALTRLANVALASEEARKNTPPLTAHGKRQDCFRIQICAGLGNQRDVGRHRLDITTAATRRWFLPNRRFSSALVSRGPAA